MAAEDLEKVETMMVKGTHDRQEYMRKKDRQSPEAFITELEHFLKKIHRDDGYHIEVRTGALLMVMLPLDDGTGSEATP